MSKKSKKSKKSSNITILPPILEDRISPITVKTPLTNFVPLPIRLSPITTLPSLKTSSPRIEYVPPEKRSDVRPSSSKNKKRPSSGKGGRKTRKAKKSKKTRKNRKRKSKRKTRKNN